MRTVSPKSMTHMRIVIFVPTVDKQDWNNSDWQAMTHLDWASVPNGTECNTGTLGKRCVLPLQACAFGRLTLPLQQDMPSAGKSCE